MKKYQFSQNRLLAKFEKPDFEGGSAESKKLDFSAGSNIDRPSGKESLQNLERGLRTLSDSMKKCEFLKVYAARIDGIREGLGTNATVSAVQKEVAKVLKEAKNKFFARYKEELVKKNPGLEWAINTGYGAAVTGIDFELNNLIDAFANAEAGKSYNAATALAEELADLADNMESLSGLMNLPGAGALNVPDPRIIH